MLYAGDLVVEGMPFIDYAAGGSSRGWVESLDGILALDFEALIPGTGPILTRRDVQVFRDRFATLRMRVMQLLYRDVPRAEALSLLQTTDLGWPLAPGGPFATGSFAALYDELARLRAGGSSHGATPLSQASSGISRGRHRPATVPGLDAVSSFQERIDKRISARAAVGRVSGRRARRATRSSNPGLCPTTMTRRAPPATPRTTSTISSGLAR